ncbi:MAG: DUF4260 domain-containing protein [Candidatus Paceibacterota bacterium]
MKKVILILKSEALALLIATILAYYFVGLSWWLFFVLLLFPDLFMVGYFKNSKIGATIYNIGHTYSIPILLLGVFIFSNISILLPISIIWIAHISMDRVLGYGLKLDTNFKDTHLGRIGKK